MELTGTQATIRTLLVLATLLPLVSSAIIIFFGKKRMPGNKTGWFTSGVLGAAFLCSLLSLLLWPAADDDGPIVWNVKWIPVAGADPAAFEATKLDGDNITGRVFIDYNGDGRKHAAEPYAQRTVYIDEALPKRAAGDTAAKPDGVQRGAFEREHAVESDADGTFTLPVGAVEAVNAGQATIKKDNWLYLGVMIDGLTIAMMVMVTLIATLVHVYSIGYMQGDKRFERFFAYLSLFTFSMMGIVVANSLMQLFVFWELVGLTSYLLIGFWFENKGPQLACKKAFVMNRIGDAGFLVGFGILFWKLGANVLLPGGEVPTGDGGQNVTGMFGALQAMLAAEGHSITDPPTWLTIAGIGLFCGAIGKSAQFPLHTWLPDAMEGPTPVSSIVHSATMVAAGVYLTARIYPILTPAAHLFVAATGLITLVIAACMAMVMTDIKRVLAYSTLSQLGYMILGLGVGAYAFALFHLITHAFFKCCLFQCSGSVINAMHHQQDMRYYGGLKDKMPKTMLAYAICTLTISGIGIMSFSIFSGFYSKDGIIAGAYNYGHLIGGWSNLFWIGPMVIAYITPFYMARSFFLTFWGKPRDRHAYDHAHEAPNTMVVPQFVLAAMALLACPWALGFFKSLIDTTSVGIANLGATWIQPHNMKEMGDGEHAAHTWLLFGLAGLIPIGIGYAMYRDGFAISEKLVKLPVIKQLYIWFKNKLYFDALYDNFAVNLGKFVAWLSGAFDKYIVDGIVNLAGWLGKACAALVGVVDSKGVDGAVNGAANFAWSFGGLMRQTHTGRIRAYVLVLLGSACLVTLMVIAIVIVNKNV